MAVRVVDTLLNAFVEDTLGASREDSENARQFLEEQVREYETRLTEAESRLAEFRRANFERLPGTEGGYFQSLQAETEALEQARKDLGLAVSRRDRILQRLRGEAPAAGDFGPTGDDQDNTLAQRIREQEKRLEELMLRYTERHPDVVGVRENLARLRERRADELAALDELSGSGPIASTNPVYQALQISLNEAEVEIATLETSLSDRQGRVARLQALVDEVPEVEAQLARLNRDYDVVQAQYQALLQSLERERLSRGAQQSERVEFRVMDPPVAGFQPAAPDRPRLLAMVLIGGLAVGGGLAFLLAQLRPVFLTADALRDATGFPVLGVVTMTRRAVRMAQRRLAILVFCLSGTSLVVAFAAVYVIEVQGPGMLNLIGRVL
jgi:polysaccharide chain length determinant protein (PEP-CTERM system associated)